jgi:hypothetical protein
MHTGKRNLGSALKISGTLIQMAQITQKLGRPAPFGAVNLNGCINAWTSQRIQH